MCDLNQTSYDMRTFGFDISTEDKIVFVIFIPNPHIDVLKILVFRCLDGTCRGVPAPCRAAAADNYFAPLSPIICGRRAASAVNTLSARRQCHDG